MMSGGNEIGISPALLQAITHTISTKPAPVHTPDVSTLHNGDNVIRTEVQSGISREPKKFQQIIKVEGQGHSMEQIQEAIASIGQQTFQSGNTIFVVQNVSDKKAEEEMVLDNVSQMVKIENGSTHLHRSSSDLENSLPEISNENTSSVMSLIASQVSEHGDVKHVRLDSAAIPLSEYAYSKLPIRVKKNHPSILTRAVVPSHVDDVTISEVDNVVTETVVQTSYHPEPLENVENTEKCGPPQAKKIRIIELPEIGGENGENATYILNSAQVGDGATGISTNQGTIVYRAVSSAIATIAGQTVQTGNISNPEFVGGCPICGDRVSGYHYGIYSCESCKGFFKRTVQNKKAFICHRMGECMVSIANRKKCPACRFKRCLVAGMKLEAIREDRTRGGRSSYDGCSPHRPVKIPKEPRKPPAPQIRPSVILNPIVIQTSTGSIAIPSTPTTSSYSIPQAASSSAPSPIAPHTLDLTQVQPQTPQLLEDLMAVESLMTEDEEEQTCCEGKMVDGDPNLFSSLLHFADHCLYKIVRWARNLPDFASVSTDDQIILLQNCWAELLCLSCCWKSIRSEPGTLKLCHGRSLSLSQARLMGLEDMAQRMLNFTDNLREMETDNYEFVAMKGLLLLSPDVKNLKDEGVIRRYQDRLIESLMIYTTTNSPKKADKFCQLLARLPELTRSCVLGKEQLTQRQQAGEVPQYSLLSELLKGDVTIA